MRHLLLALTVAFLAPCAVAQQAPTQANPTGSSPTHEPSSSMQEPSTDGTGNYSNGSGDDKWSLKTCLAKQRKENPQLSEADMKRTCAKLKPKTD